MNFKILVIAVILLFSQQVYSQENYKTVSKADSTKIYIGGLKYEVKTFSQDFKAKKPRNVIMMIGDGMGVAQVSAALTANGGQLFLDNFKHVGFSKTSSSDNYITDSAAGRYSPFNRPENLQRGHWGQHRYGSHQNHS